MSDIRYRTDAQLRSDVKFNRGRQNTHKMRADAAENELARRERARESARVRAAMHKGVTLYPYQQALVDWIRAGGSIPFWPRGVGRTLIEDVAAGALVEEGPGVIDLAEAEQRVMATMVGMVRVENGLLHFNERFGEQADAVKMTGGEGVKHQWFGRAKRIKTPGEHLVIDTKDEQR